MEEKQRELFLMRMKDRFPMDKTSKIKEELLKLNNDQFIVIQSTEYKNPLTMFIISLLLGGAGIDRLILGYKKFALVKVVLWVISSISTLASAEIWAVPYLIIYIRDVVIIHKLTKKWNYEKLMNTINMLNKNSSNNK